MKKTKRNIKRIISAMLFIVLTVSSIGMVQAKSVTDTALYTGERKADNYTITLGNAIWMDDTHTKYNFPHAEVTKNAGVADAIYSITISVENGTSTRDENADIKINAYANKGYTCIYTTPKTVEEIQDIVRKLEFTPNNAGTNMNVTISVSGNVTSGLDANIIKDLTYNSDNGHYYLRTDEMMTWLEAYNRAKEYIFNGRRGYILTLNYDDSEYKFFNSMSGFFVNLPHVGAGRIVNTDGSQIDDAEKITSYKNSKEGYTTDQIYYVCGPEAGMPYTISKVAGNQGDDSWECILVGTHATLGPGVFDERATTEPYHNLVVEFGGYEDKGKRDPGGYEAENETESTLNNVEAVDSEATINGIKYGKIKDALSVAKSGDTVQIIRDTVTECTDAEMKNGVILVLRDGITKYTSTTDSKIDAASDGSITLIDGILDTTANAPIKVVSPEDGKTYSVTAPDSKSTIDVDKKNRHAFFRGENDGVVKIDDISYTYKNPDASQSTLVYIPDAMEDNEYVTKAELSADKAVEIGFDGGKSIILNGDGQASDKVVVVRRNDGRADVTLPSGTSASVLGHTVGNAPDGGVTVSQPNADNTDYPSRDYITVNKAGESVTVDSMTYTAENDAQRIPLGTFAVTVNTGDHAHISGSEPARPYYGQQYSVTVEPDEGETLNPNVFSVKMRYGDMGTEKELELGTVCSDNQDGTYTFAIPKVTGAVNINVDVVLIDDSDNSGNTIIGILEAKDNPGTASFEVPLYIVAAAVKDSDELICPDGYYIKNTGIKEIGVTTMAIERLNTTAEGGWKMAAPGTAVSEARTMTFTIGDIGMPALDDAVMYADIDLKASDNVFYSVTEAKYKAIGVGEKRELVLSGTVDGGKVKADVKAVPQFKVMYTVSALDESGQPIGNTYVGNNKAAAFPE